MTTQSPKPPPVPILRRFWKPAVATGAAGGAVAVWLEELVLFGEAILALIFLPIMAGLIYLFDLILFKARMPRREDVNSTIDRGAKK